MMFKHHASRFFSLAILTLLIASCSSAPQVASEGADIGYLFTADSDGTVTVEKAARLVSGQYVTESDLATQQQNADAGTLADDMARDQLVLSFYSPTLLTGLDTNGNGNIERTVIVDTRWTNGTGYFFQIPLFTNAYQYRLVDCFVVNNGSGVTNNGDDCLGTDIKDLIDRDDVNSVTNAQGPGEVIPDGGGTFAFNARFENGDRIRFFVVPSIPAAQVCLEGFDSDPSSSTCGQNIDTPAP